MSDDIDRTDELLDMIAEDQRHEAASNGWPDHIPTQDEPPDDDEHHAGENSTSDDSDDLETAIQHRTRWLRVNREANRRLDDENQQQIVLPPVTSLNSLLDEADDPVAYRIDQLAPKQGNVILSAQYKAGKTIMGGNLIRSLVDGDPFLDRFTVHERAEHLVLIDNELGRTTVRRWLRDQSIRNTRAVADVITLRGRVSMRSSRPVRLSRK